MCECKSNNADVAMWPPSGMQTLLREDHPDGSQPTLAAAEMRHLPGQDPTTAASSPAGHQQELAGQSTLNYIRST